MSSLFSGLILPPRVTDQGAYTVDDLVNRLSARQFQFTTRNGYYTMLVALRVTYITDATVGARRLLFELNIPGFASSGGNASVSVSAFTSQAASEARGYLLAPDVDGVDGGAGVTTSTRIPRIIVPPLTTVKFYDPVAVGAGDLFSNPMFVRSALFASSGVPQGQLLPAQGAAAEPLDLAAAGLGG